MKTFSTTVKHFVILPGIFLKTIILSVMFLIPGAGTASAQGTLTGFVVDDEFNTPLEKAVVTIPGTLISVLTDQQGKYVLKLVAGDYQIEVNYPGYFGKKYNMSVSDGISTPMFIVKLKANAVGRAMQRSIASYENNRQFPQTIEDFSTWKIAEQNGNQEFNALFRTIPSVSYFSNGSGFNDSEIGLRGNGPNQTSYTFNGILLNNPETGRVGSSMLSGLTDRAGQIQVSSGQAANLQSQSKSGGLVNVISAAPHEKAGADVLTVFGSEGFLKTSATIHSGLSKKGLASSIQVSRTSGNGLAQNTAFEQYAFFLTTRKEFNQFHTLELNVNGIIQQHDRNSSDSVGAYNRYGIKYNRNWGTLMEKPVSWSTNFERNPLISLTHYWHPRVNTQVTTQVFAQFRRSAQQLPGAPVTVPRDSSGLIMFGKISDWNKGMAVAEMGATRTPDENGKFINSEDSGITTLAGIDSENRFGLRTVLKHNFSKKLDLSVSLMLEHYQASHFGAVHDLLGADGYSSFSDLNRPEGFAVENQFQSKFFPLFNSAGETAYFYESGIQTGGLSGRMNYRLSRFYWFAEGSASLQNIRRTDHFNYLSTDPERQTEFALLPGGHIQTGIRLYFWKYHSIHLRAGYGSYQPLFSTIYPSGNNWENRKAANEQVFDAEFGYTIFSRKLKVEALAYRSMVNNRPVVRHFNLNAGDSFVLINGLDELHQGVELKTSYKLTKNLQLKLNGSLGDWKYSRDALAQIYDGERLLTSENELWLKRVRIANAPQLYLFAEAEYRWAHNFYIGINYSRSDRIYAPFGLYDFTGLTNRSDFEQWKLPSYQLLGASGNYLLKIWKSHTLNLLFGADNLLDSEYIEQSLTNIPEGKPGYTGNQVHYGTGRTWFAGIRYQF